MTNNCTAPPLFRRPSSPSFSSVPDEIVVNFLARISKSHYRSLSTVSKSFHSLLSSPEIYSARSQIGATEPRLYLCIRLPTAPHRRWFTLKMNTDQIIISKSGEIKTELSLVPVKRCPSAQLHATSVAVGSEIYQIGGSNEDKRSRAVRVLDCRSHTWRRGPDMKVARKRAKSCFLDGKIYVMGGCRKREESMNWGEVFELKTQTWKGPLPKPPLSDDDDRRHKVLVLGGRLYVITEHNKYAYDPEGERWLVLEMGLMIGLEDIVISRREPWCVVEDVVFHVYGEKLCWYDVRCGDWLRVEGLSELYTKRAVDCRTIQLVNYGGKLVMIWHEWADVVLKKKKKHGHYVEYSFGILDKRIWLAVIRLEERGTQIWGELERCNVFDHAVPLSYKFLPSLSVSL